MQFRDAKTGWIILALLGCFLALIPCFAALTGQSLLAAKPAWFVFSIGCGLVLLGASASRGHAGFGIVAMSVLIGGASALWLTDPLFFPSKTTDITSMGNLIAAMLLAAQAAIALHVLWPVRAMAIEKVNSIGPARLTVLIAVGAVLSISIMNYLPQGHILGFSKQVFLGGAVMGIQILSIAALSLLPAPGFLRLPKGPWLASVVALASSALLAWLAVEFVPHVEDELAYLFQARTFLGGHLTAPSPPAGLADGLDYYLLTQSDGQWMAVTTPGWPAVLTLGVLLGQPWLLNPVLAAVSVWLTYQICARWSTMETAGMTAIMLAVSPWFLGSAATLMPHLAALTFTLLAWWVLSKSSERVPALFFAGLLMGLVFTIRQLEAVLVGTLTGVVLLYLLWQRGKPAIVVAYGLGCLATGALLFAYNHAVSGTALQSPLQTYLNDLWHVGANRYGFGADIGPTERWGALDYAAGHSLSEALVITAHNLFYLNFELFGWLTGSILLALFHLLFGQQNKCDAVAWAVVVIVPLAHLGYWFSGSFYIGPRYWFAMLVPVTYLSARGALTLRARANISSRQLEAVLLVMCIFSVSVFLTWRGAEKYYGYGNYSGAVRMAAATGQFGNDVVVYEASGNAGSAMFLNDPYLPDDKPIFVAGPVARIVPPAGRNIAIWGD